MIDAERAHCSAAEDRLTAGTDVISDALRPRGGVVTQRTANPRTPVQFRAWPPS